MHHSPEVNAISEDVNMDEPRGKDMHPPHVESMDISN